MRGSGDAPLLEAPAYGDIVLSPKNIPHGLRAGQSEDFSVLVVKTPNPEKLNKGDGV
ncbi:MAG: hypothetical protein QME82_08440 [Bacillota bacterium]|nr:hypothetical protein [Bacillota bacterium]MDI6638915.1 hypothetical protein [Bacillota bacterium]